MKLILEPTGTIDTINGQVQARIWEGRTESGVPVKAWIATVQPQTDDPELILAFARELREIKAERRLLSFDVRMVI